MPKSPTPTITITITGPQGSGKSTIAQALAYLVRHHFATKVHTSEACTDMLPFRKELPPGVEVVIVTEQGGGDGS